MAPDGGQNPTFLACGGVHGDDGAALRGIGHLTPQHHGYMLEAHAPPCSCLVCCEGHMSMCMETEDDRRMLAPQKHEAGHTWTPEKGTGSTGAGQCSQQPASVQACLIVRTYRLRRRRPRGAWGPGFPFHFRVMTSASCVHMLRSDGSGTAIEAHAIRADVASASAGQPCKLHVCKGVAISAPHALALHAAPGMLCLNPVACTAWLASPAGFLAFRGSPDCQVMPHPQWACCLHAMSLKVATDKLARLSFGTCALSTERIGRG